MQGHQCWWKPLNVAASDHIITNCPRPNAAHFTHRALLCNRWVITEWQNKIWQPITCTVCMLTTPRTLLCDIHSLTTRGIASCHFTHEQLHQHLISAQQPSEVSLVLYEHKRTISFSIDFTPTASWNRRSAHPWKLKAQLQHLCIHISHTVARNVSRVW